MVLDPLMKIINNPKNKEHKMYWVGQKVRLFFLYKMALVALGCL